MEMNILEYMEFMEIPLYLYTDLSNSKQLQVLEEFFHRLRYLFEKKDSKEILLDVLKKYNDSTMKAQ